MLNLKKEDLQRFTRPNVFKPYVQIGVLPEIKYDIKEDKYSTQPVFEYLRAITNKINTWEFNRNTRKINELLTKVNNAISELDKDYKFVPSTSSFNDLINVLNVYVKLLFKTPQDKFKQEYIELCQKYKLELYIDTNVYYIIPLIEHDIKKIKEAEYYEK